MIKQANLQYLVEPVEEAEPPEDIEQDNEEEGNGEYS